MKVKSIKRQIISLILIVLLVIPLMLTVLQINVFAATKVLPEGSTSEALQNAINGAGPGDTIVISSSISFDKVILVPPGRSVIIEAKSESDYLDSNDYLVRHFRVAGTLTLQNVKMNGSGFSGGIVVEEGGTLNVNDGAVLEYCLADFGGIIENHGTVNIYGGEIRDNTALEYGGAILQLGTLNMYAGNITGNSAKEGGAIYLASESVTNISGTNNFSNNTCTRNGGAIFVDIAAKLNVDGNSSFSNNIAEKSGGAIYTEDTTYRNIITSGNTAFSENQSSKSSNPPINAKTLYPNIGFTSASINNHPLNDYDINYKEAYVHVSYDANGGTGSYVGPDTQVDATDNILSLADTGISNPDYAFIGWNTLANGTGVGYKPGDSITLNGSITLYAQWEKGDQHIVTFESNGGTPIEQQGVPFDLKVPKPEDPTKEGYAFSGWYTDNETFLNEWDFNKIVTENMTLYAKWMAEDGYTVTFESNGGTAVDNQIVPEGGVVTIPTNPTRPYYLFDGWYTDDGTFLNEWNFETPITEDITLYAKWREVTGEYTVNFDSNGGTTVDSQTVPAGDVVTKPTDPTRRGYIFEGWYTDNGTFENEWDFNSPVIEGITLYAKWRINPNVILIWTLISIFAILAILMIFNGGIGKSIRCTICKIKKRIRCLKCKCKK